MKKLLFIFGFALSLMACAGNSTSGNTDTQDSVVIDTIDSNYSTDTIAS